VNKAQLPEKLEALLPKVETPGQYVGGEVNSIVKTSADIRAALCFPDTYSVGMSHLGLKILYQLLNSLDGVAAERCFTPRPDMIELLREHKLPLWGLESFTPLSEFDLIGFSLQYELTYTNVLTMLDLAGLPLRSSERNNSHPLIIAGGPCAYNPEPLADFIDLFLIGEGEESLPELISVIRELGPNCSREQLLAECARRVPGAYAPALFEVSYHKDGRISCCQPRLADIPANIERRVVENFESSFASQTPVIPFVDVVHDRLSVEIMRGCAHGCRFCQAGTTYRPLRARSVERILEIVATGLASTGYDEIGLLSLSTSDYPHLAELVTRLTDLYAQKGVSISLPSLRVNQALAEVPALVSTVRKGAITVAPEAGTERLRRIINKQITDAELFEGVSAAFAAGWNRVKLYFMTGLPGEEDDDLTGIAGLIERVAALARKQATRGGKVNASISNFVPKPGTPFQWEAMASAEDFEAKRQYVRSQFRGRRKNWNLKFHDIGPSMLEGAIARGDRRLGAVIESAWRSGCRLDAWSEYYRQDLWDAAFAENEIDPNFYTTRTRELDEILPWGHISQGVSNEFLIAERQRARAGEFTDDCPMDTGEEACTACGACP
jgi:radical SAM family uncharacterized protein